MSSVRTQWRIDVHANTKAARAELGKFVKTAQAANTSFDNMFANVNAGKSARTFKNVGHELNKMNAAVKRGKVSLGSWNKYWQHSNNLIRKSKQLQTAHTITVQRHGGVLTSTTAVMKNFNKVAVTTGQRLAYMNTWFRAASRNAINAAKNIQWSGRQITVGFGVPFAMAMAGASMAFFQFEEQVVRFRKVFNDELNSLSIDESVERVTNLANTMATQLGIARNEVMETSAIFAQMGYSTPEIERLTRAATELAMLGEVDPSDATDLLRAYSASGFFERFEGDAEEFEETIKNMLNAIENSTGLTVEMMADNMSQLIPLFNQFQFERGEGESILAGMTEALGGQAAEAATALKTIMNRVYTDSKQTKDNFQKIGINIESLQERYKGDIRGLLAELGRLLETNDELRDSNLAAAETFGKLFGIRQVARGIAAIRSISNGYDEAGEAANDFGRALNVAQQDEENAARAARELKEQAESVGGQFRRLKEAVIIAATSIGETFLDMVMPAVKVLRDVVKWFSNASEAFQRFTIGSGLVIVAVGGLLTTVGVLAQAVLAIARGIGFLLPKYNLWTEETFRNRTATSHLDHEMKELRQTVQSIRPVFDSIEQAQRDIARTTDRATSAIQRQSSAMRGHQSAAAGMGGYSVGSSVWGGQRTTGMPIYRPGYDVGVMGANVYAPGAEPIRGAGGTPSDAQMRAEAAWRRGPTTDAQGRLRDHRGRFMAADTQSSGYPIPVWRRGIQGMSDEALSAQVIGSLSGGGRRQSMRRNAMARNRAVLNRGPSAMKWRRGASAAGGLAMMGGMFAPGAAGGALMGAGMGLEGLSMLASPKIQRGAANLSQKLLKSSEGAKGIKAGVKGGLGSMISLVGSTGGLALILGGVAATAFLITKHVKDVREEAKMLRNEFELSNSVAEELGLTVDDVDLGFDLSRKVSESDAFGDMSDDMQSMVRTFEDAQDKGQDYVQSVARNLARQWREGGASIEEVDRALDDLEARVGVEIDPIDIEGLGETIGEDIANSIRLSMEGFTGNDFSLKWMPWTDQEFNAAEEQMIHSSVTALQDAIRNNPEAINPALEAFTESVNNNPLLNRFEKSNALGRYRAMLADINRMSPEIAAQAEDTEELVALILRARYEQQVAMGEAVSPELLEALELHADIAENEFVFTDEDLERMKSIRGELAASNREILQVADLDMSEVGPFNIENVEDADKAISAYKNAARGYMDDVGHRFNSYLDVSENLEVAISNTTDELERARLTAFLRALENANSLAEVLEFRFSSIQDLGEDSWMNWSTPLDTGTDAGEPDVDTGTDGEEDGNEYAEALRSALDDERNNITSYLVDQFDEATDGIVEAAEDQRDARIEALEEAQEAEIEGLEDARDAELDALEERKEAIDDYLDKQEEIQEAMQQQIDLVTALATGDRAKAAQIQNAIRFGTIEDMAESEKDRIDDERDAVKDRYDDEIEATKELHDQRMEQEKEYFDNHIENIKDSREAQKQALKDNLEDLDSMFLGTQKDWNAFIAEAQSIAGTKLPPAMRGGFDKAMTAVVEAKTLDRLWDEADFSGLSNEIEKAIIHGVNAANNILLGWTTAEGKDPGFSSDLAALLESYGTRGASEFHTGGQVGGGPPRDVPALLQTGEYVIQRKAAQALGQDRLAQMNNAHKYHSGGNVQAQGAGFAQIGATIGSLILSTMKAGIADKMSVMPAFGTGGMDRSKWGGRTWGQIAPNTAAAQNWVKSAFDINFASAGTNRGDRLSDHSYGKATDIFPGSPSEYAAGDDLATGNAIARWFMNNQEAFGTKYVIWQGRIANPSIGGGKWRPYTRLKGVTGGHYDHVHVSFLHGGGPAGSNMVPMRKGGRLKTNNVPALLHRDEAVLRAPIAKSLEDGIRNISTTSRDGGLTIHVENFVGTEENIDKFGDKVMSVLDRHNRKVNPTRSFG